MSEAYLCGANGRASKSDTVHKSPIMHYLGRQDLSATCAVLNSGANLRLADFAPETGRSASG